MLFCLPVTAKAEVKIVSTSLNGPLNVEEGTSFTMTVNINVSGLSTTADSALGIGSVIFVFGVDENVFILESVSAEGFESVAQKVNGVYYIVSAALPNNNCGLGVLYCGNYKAELKFYVKNTTLNYSVITLGEAGIGLIDVETYQTEEDVITEVYDEYKPHSIMIDHKKASEEIEPPKTIILEKKEKPNVTETPKVNNSSTNNKPTIKSSNALLKSLTVENYDIKFDTYLLDYTLEIEENVNNLSIKAEPEDTKASYKVVGAEDLKANGNKVTVEITAENGNKKIYTINTKVKEKKPEKEKSVEKVEPKKEEAKVNKKFLLYFGILFGGIVLLGVFGFIISKIKNRKLNKMLDQL